MSDLEEYADEVKLIMDDLKHAVKNLLKEVKRVRKEADSDEWD